MAGSLASFSLKNCVCVSSLDVYISLSSWIPYYSKANTNEEAKLSYIQGGDVECKDIISDL